MSTLSIKGKKVSSNHETKVIHKEEIDYDSFSKQSFKNRRNKAKDQMRGDN